MQTRTINGVEVHRSSGNVFADLALPDADRLKVKSDLMIAIQQTITRLGLNQKTAAQRMGLTQPKLSRLLHGNFENVSERKLMDCLNRLGYDIEIRLKPARQPVGHLVLAASA